MLETLEIQKEKSTDDKDDSVVADDSGMGMDLITAYTIYKV